MADARLAQFSDAVLKGARNKAPKSSIKEVSKAMEGTFALGAVQRAGKGQGVAATQIAEDEERRRQAALAARQAELQDKLDPSKYKQVRKEDGGFAFYDPTGKEIDIADYASVTGLRRVDILKDSENPIDQQYMQDYSTINDITQALWTGDKETVDGLKGQYPQLFTQGMTPEMLSKQLMDWYPHMYKRGGYQQTLRNLNKPLFPLSVGGIGAGSSFADQLSALSQQSGGR